MAETRNNDDKTQIRYDYEADCKEESSLHETFRLSPSFLGLLTSSALYLTVDSLVSATLRVGPFLHTGR